MIPQGEHTFNSRRRGRPDLPSLAQAITAHLERAGAERQHGGELIFRCPAPGHEDRNPSASWNAGKGLWCCHSRGCHEAHGGGGALPLAALLGIDVDAYRTAEAEGQPGRRRAAAASQGGTGPTKTKGQAQHAPAAAVAAPAATYAGLADFEARRGLPDGYLAGAPWNVAEGRLQRRPALLWPTLPGMPSRVKFLDGRGPTGHGSKYTWKGKGGRVHVYGLPLALERLAADPSAPLYVVNGEPSTWAAAAAGLAVVCFAGGEGTTKPAPELAAALATVGRPVAVRVAYDVDLAGQAGGPKVAAALKALGLDVAALDLAAWPGWQDAGGMPDGADVGDLAQAARPAELAAALAALPATDAGEAAAAATVGARWQGIPYCRPGEWECDDYGNGGRLVSLYGDRLRWHAARRAWYLFDGRRWVDDCRGEAARLVRLTVRSILHEAADEADDDRRNALMKWHKTSANSGRPSEMLSRARIDLTTPGEDWDRSPWALNLLNGTLDLRTGALSPHDPADYLTLLAPVEFHPGAHLAEAGPLAAGAALWRRFLADATGGDAALAAYLQRAAGATLAGDTRGTDALFFIHGPGGTGKSTFAKALFKVLGDYAETVDAGALMKAREATGPRPEIAKLQGKRMAVAFEAESGRAFNDALVKTLTGGDTISARMLHANPVTFQPQFTFWLVANDQPRADVNDSGFWRRVKTLPFKATPPGPPDHTLRDRLPLEAGPAILAWAFEGCQAWQAGGLGPAPDAVEAATADYRASVDPLRGWIADRCTLAPLAWTAAGVLYDDYKGWALGAVDAPLSARDFGIHLTARLGASSTRRLGGAKVRGYLGIGLLSDTDPDGWNSGTDGTEKSQKSLKEEKRLSDFLNSSVPSVPLFQPDAEPHQTYLPGEV